VVHWPGIPTAQHPALLLTCPALPFAFGPSAAAPYGIESFDDVLEPLWKGIRLLRGKASWLQAIAPVVLPS